ncbi:cytochrome C biosynthesis protein [Sphingobium sp.]|uniref:tetratricopeptide repeat protein n=1 Tax=Sphingobium sp. TaxID=1912891 RepID=UPI00260FD26B|nr:cytochrome C biosynthesis protein [Sphingobium sp.]
MTGWVIAFALAALAFVAMLFIGRIPRAAREVTAAALLLGLAGYAWQGHPGMAGAPRAVAETKGDAFDEEQAEKRRGLAERFGPAAQWMMLSDGLARQGKSKEAANVLLSGLRDSPDDANLWLGMGNALVNHADGVLSPGAQFAYRRALAIDPTGPAPRYFYGLALARNNQLQGARDMWAPLAAGAPAGSQVKAELEANIARIDAMLANGDPVSQ